MSSIDIASSIWATLGSLVGMTTGRSQPWPAPRAVRVIGSILDCRYMDCDRDSDRDSDRFVDLTGPTKKTKTGS